jgi:glycosyltransferase involved in cell wall biosynthesis
MLIAIVHYHLNSGGVTQVIANHLRALQLQAADMDALRVVILHGGRQDGWPDHLPDTPTLRHEVRAIVGLDYDDQPRDGGDLARAIQSALDDAGGSPASTVVHVHNHSLGKNPTLPSALYRLAEDGWPLLLHLHDFAEDFRPDNYRRLTGACGREASSETISAIYPTASHVHYAVLNQRDAGILSTAGVDPAQLHVLPNAVGDLGGLPSRQAARQELHRVCGIPPHRPLLLYPVRGIRRKNLGEALMWSSLAGDRGYVGMTLAPATPAEIPSYQRWKSLAASWGLPMVFELGNGSGLSYADNLAAADRMLTTSVAEGFGLVFLESWLAGKSLAGRDLPEITSDFVAAGLRLDELDSRLVVPLDWVGSSRWQRAFQQAYAETLARFGRPGPSPAVFRDALDELSRDGWVDFAALPSGLQQNVIELVSRSSKRRHQVLARNPRIASILDAVPPSQDTIIHNAQVVRSAYSLAACGQRLVNLYRDILSRPSDIGVRPLAGSERILDEFLKPARFHPIRVEA